MKGISRLLERERLTSFLDQAKGLAQNASGKLPFHEKFVTRVSVRTLWYELQKAIVKSETSELWPNEYVTMECDGLEPHAVIEVNYKFLFTKTACQYKITDIDQRNHTIKYRALKQHIFEGGGEIKISPKGAGSVLEWQGEYLFERPKSIQALVFSLYLQERFFARLRTNLKKISQT